MATNIAIETTLKIIKPTMYLGGHKYLMPFLKLEIAQIRVMTKIANMRMAIMIKTGQSIRFRIPMLYVTNNIEMYLLNQLTAIVLFDLTNN